MFPIKTKFFTFIFVFTSIFCGFFPQSAHADAWGTNYGAALVKQLMENIQRQIEGAILGTQKMIAIQLLNSKVGRLLGGSTGGKPLFITNFDEFLYRNPQQNTNLVMNDFFSLTTRGRGSSVNYISRDDKSESYNSYLTDLGRKATIEKDNFGRNTLDDFGGMAAFSEGDPRAFNAFFTNPLNNPVGYVLTANTVYEDELIKQQKIAEMKALSSGVLPSESDGIITAPSSAIEATLNNIADLPNKMIAAASNPGELLSGVISSMANRLVTNMIQKGVGEIQSKISREIRNVDRQVSKEINSQVNIMGPVGRFTNTTKGIGNINTKTPAPPVALQKNR